MTDFEVSTLHFCQVKSRYVIFPQNVFCCISEALPKNNPNITGVQRSPKHYHRMNPILQVSKDLPKHYHGTNLILQAYREFSKQIDEYKANNAIIEYLKTPLTPAEIKALESKPVVTVEEHVTGTVIPVSVPVPTAPGQVTGNRQGVSVGLDCIVLILGSGWYQKCVRQEIANAKLYRFWNSAFLVQPNQTWTSPITDIALKVPKYTKC